MTKKKTIPEQTNTIVQLCLDTKITLGGQGGWVWGLGVAYSATYMGYTITQCDALKEMVLEQFSLK